MGKIKESRITQLHYPPHQRRRFILLLARVLIGLHQIGTATRSQISWHVIVASEG